MRSEFSAVEPGYLQASAASVGWRLLMPTGSDRRGPAQALDDDGGLIRITADRIISWGLD